jgi:DNA replication and repair protein RecF
VALTSVTLRDFRGYRAAEISLGRSITVVCGPNGAGKTNLLESVYFGATARSCRTGNDREVIRFGAGTTRVVLRTEDEDGGHEFAVGFSPGEPKRMTADGAPVERLLDAPGRPLVSVFLPDRLDLVKGVPAARRAHLDQFVAALWPSRSAARRAFAATLGQRNALLARLRAGHGSVAMLDTWDLQLARHALALMADRREAVEQLAPAFAGMCERLGLDGEPTLSYRPRSRATREEDLIEELRARRDADLERGYSGHGPHRDDLGLSRGGRELRTYGSQGQQRIGLLGLLLAEREVLGQARSEPPVMLLDDVMSELDPQRRDALVEVLRDAGGQSLITTTELEHVPGAAAGEMTTILVSEGEIVAGAIQGTGALVGTGASREADG